MWKKRSWVELRNSRVTNDTRNCVASVTGGGNQPLFLHRRPPKFHCKLRFFHLSLSLSFVFCHFQNRKPRTKIPTFPCSVLCYMFFILSPHRNPGTKNLFVQEKLLHLFFQRRTPSVWYKASKNKYFSQQEKFSFCFIILGILEVGVFFLNSKHHCPLLLWLFLFV